MSGCVKVMLREFTRLRSTFQLPERTNSTRFESLFTNFLLYKMCTDVGAELCECDFHGPCCIGQPTKVTASLLTTQSQSVSKFIRKLYHRLHVCSLRVSCRVREALGSDICPRIGCPD
jgi:hypothetical protein